MRDTLSKTKMIFKRHYAKSSSFFMAVTFTILCGAAAISFGYFINYFAKGHFIQSTEAVLDSEIRYIETLDTMPSLLENQGRLYVPLNDDGSLPEDIPVSVQRLAEGIIVFDYPVDDKRYAAKIHTFLDGHKVLVGFDITNISQDFKFMQWLGIASIGFVMIVVLISYLISFFVVEGTNKIAKTAQDIIATGDLSRRVAVASRWDDLSNMAAVLNLLLDRVEELMQGVRQVSDNIAHDLRTPLTRMRNHIETLKEKNKKSKDYDGLMDEADHLLSTFNALLRISRIETERQRSRFQTLALHDVLNDVVEFYEPLAEEKNIKIDCSLAEVSCFGDRDLLFQAFANLFDNAVKFTPKNGTITVSLEKRDDKARFTIMDSGSGIDEAEKEKIFDRFYRAEKSRTTSGTGLGLSLVMAVIKLHDGEIIAENAHPGLKIITII